MYWGQTSVSREWSFCRQLNRFWLSPLDTSTSMAPTHVDTDNHTQAHTQNRLDCQSRHNYTRPYDNHLNAPCSLLATIKYTGPSSFDNINCSLQLHTDTHKRLTNSTFMCVYICTLGIISSF